jgi:glycosyltransferase involved in cell wall biosynthesis
MLLSIITINLNNKKGLTSTIESVYKFLNDGEYIIVDGGSNDGSIEVINNIQRNEFIPIVGKDKGIYDAMNIGLKRASGKYILFLNSGDVLIDQIPYHELKNEDYDFLIYGTDLNNGFIKTVNRSLTYFIRELSLPHQSTFIRKRLFDIWGEYNINYSITGDYEWFCRVITQSHLNTLSSQRILVLMEPNGVGSVESCDWCLERDWVKFKYFYSTQIITTLRTCWPIWLRSFKSKKFKNRANIL